MRAPLEDELLDESMTSRLSARCTGAPPLMDRKRFFWPVPVMGPPGCWCRGLITGFFFRRSAQVFRRASVRDHWGPVRPSDISIETRRSGPVPPTPPASWAPGIEGASSLQRALEPVLIHRAVTVACVPAVQTCLSLRTESNSWPVPVVRLSGFVGVRSLTTGRQ